jgi:DNA-binding NarL/FixJ family response regulator
MPKSSILMGASMCGVPVEGESFGSAIDGRPRIASLRGVSKQRPSAKPKKGVPAKTKARKAPEALPASTAEWLPRLFRNSYTRTGQRFEVEGWAIKIQHQGRRRTFSLSSETKDEAAVEARAIHETILVEGWEAALRGFPPRNSTDRSSKADAAYWQQRLLRRRYRFPGSGEQETDLAARIDHGGIGYYFPLGTQDPEIAATKAHQIYRFVLRHGWEKANRTFSRELIVGFEWSANPILWTYTTVHTLVDSPEPPQPEDAAAGKRILIVETDDGLRRALAWCINQQKDCVAVVCDSVASFDAAMERHRPHLVLLNRSLSERVGYPSPGEFAQVRPGVPALTFSAAPDGDQMFVSTPGGAVGYLLRRVDPSNLLKPMLDLGGQIETDPGEALSRVKSFFQKLLRPKAGQEDPGLARLTRRELEVLTLLSKGCVDKEIAQALGISAWTVHGHIKNIFERLHVRTRTEAVVRFLEK